MILRDGYSTIISFEILGGGALFKEKTVTPPGLDGGGMIDTTSMRNSVWRTRFPKALVTLSEMTVTVEYDPDLLIELISTVLNVNQLITVEFPDGSIFQFAGWLNEFKPQEHREGENPVATMTIIPSNVNPEDDESEIAPSMLA